MNLDGSNNGGMDESHISSDDLSLSLTEGPWSPHSQPDTTAEDDKIKNWKAAGRAVRQILTQVNVQQLANDDNTSPDKFNSGRYEDALDGNKYADFSRTQYFPSLGINSTSDAMNEMLDEFKAKGSLSEKKSMEEDNQDKCNIKKDAHACSKNRQQLNHRNNNILKPSKTMNDLQGFSNLNCQSPIDSYTDKITHSYSSTELSRMNDSSDTRCSFDCVLPSPLMSNGEDDSCDLERSRTLLEASFNDIQMDAVAEDKCITSDTISSRSNSVSNEKNNAHFLYGLALNEPNNPCKDTFNFQPNVSDSKTHTQNNIQCNVVSEGCDSQRRENLRELNRDKDIDTKSQWQELKEKIARLTGKKTLRDDTAQDQTKNTSIDMVEDNPLALSNRSHKIKSRTDSYFTKKQDHVIGSSSDSDDSTKNPTETKPKRYSEHRRKISRIQDKLVRNDMNGDKEKNVGCDSNSMDDSQINGGLCDLFNSSVPPVSVIQLGKTSDFGDVSFLKTKKDASNIPRSLHGRKSKQCINSSANILLQLNDDRIETLKTMMNVKPKENCDCVCVNCDTEAAIKPKNSIISSDRINNVNSDLHRIQYKSTLNTGPISCKNKDNHVETCNFTDCDKTKSSKCNSITKEQQLLSDLKHKNELLLTSNTKRLSGIKNSTNAKVPSTSSSQAENVQNMNTFPGIYPSPYHPSSPLYCRGTGGPHPFFQAVMDNVFPFNRRSYDREPFTSVRDTRDDLPPVNPSRKFECGEENDEKNVLETKSVSEDSSSSGARTDKEDNTELDSMPELISSTDDEVQQVALEMEHTTQQFRSPQSDQMDNSDLIVQETCESDYGDDFKELHISSNIHSDEEEQPAITISPRDIDSLPELLFSSDESKSGSEADDEFECDCAVCFTNTNENEDVESLPSLHDDLHNVSSDVLENIFEENVPNSNTSPNNSESQADFELFPFLPFSIRLSELSPFDLLITRQSRRDLLEIMFQNVFMQMLAVYPELLSDRAPPPLNPEDLSSIPVINIDESQLAIEAKCPICLCEFEEGEEARKLQCTHTFHNLCIEAWFAKSGTCPVCRDVITSQQNQPQE